MIRTAQSKDALAIADIYNHYILNTHVTFEENQVVEQTIKDRIFAYSKLPWLVFEENNLVLGYCYAVPWKPRSAYRYTLETSIYISPKHQHKQIGKQLYSYLIHQLKENEYYSLLAGIALPNEGSIRFHEKLGFRKVGQLEQVGFKFNRWIDVGYWELNFQKEINLPSKNLP